MGMTTWNKELAEVISFGKKNDVIIAKTPNDEAVWDKEFDNSFGMSEGVPVLAWSETRVYFPAVYDGSEWLASAPRNPQDEAEGHIGGGVAREYYTSYSETNHYRKETIMYSDFLVTIATFLYAHALIICFAIIALAILNGVRLLARSVRRQRWILRQIAAKNQSVNWAMLESL